MNDHHNFAPDRVFFFFSKRHMLVSSHDSISMQDAINACKRTEAYLNKTAAFLISCLWNSVQKVKDYLKSIKLDKVFLHTV